MSEPAEPRPETRIGLHSVTGERVSVASSSSTRLLATFGDVEGDPSREVLVGLVDFALYTMADEDKSEESIQLTLTVENMSFLLADMSRDFAEVCKGLAKLSSDKAPVEKSRLAVMQEFLKRMRESVEEAETALKDITV